MGCDIHGPYVYGKRELMPGKPWWDLIAGLNWNRDYCLFGYLADVRNEDGGHTPISEPRGINPNWDPSTFSASRHMFDSESVHEDCEGWHEHRTTEDCHSQSWTTTDELVELQVRYAGHEHVGVPRRPNPEVAMAIALMRTAEDQGYTDVHIGYCFDN